MKKVGLVSVCNYNYGSILQAFAFQQLLFDNGIDNEIIIYKKKKSMKQFLRVFNYPLLKAKTKSIWRSVYCRFNKDVGDILRKRNAKFEDFVTKNLVFSQKYIGRTALKEGAKQYAAFVLGSDQVWNPMLLGGDYYTLTWVDNACPKVTYASSFGVSEIPSSQVKKTREYLSRFNMISVREKQGAEIVKKLTGKKAEVCCDPTLLTDRKRWDELSGKNPFVSGKYIFCYFIGNNPSQREFAKRLAKKTGCKILAVKHIDEYIKSDDDFGDIDYLEVGPKEFVNFIRYATYVCTDSFHGTIFSIIYNKTFFTFKRFLDGQKSSMNSRVKNFLSIAGLSNRLFENSTTPEDALAYQVDWTDVNMRLNDFRKSSQEYFERAVKCLKGMKE